MELGGNKPFKEFFNAHSSNTMMGREFDSCTIAERYDSEAGEEWKERLTAKVEGVEYVPGAKPPKKTTPAPQPRQQPLSSGRNTPTSLSNSATPQRTMSPSQKSRNEAYFASKGAENEARPEGLAPSQGGKYSGFGSAPPPTSNNSSTPAGIADFQADPVAALTKSFSWFSSTVTKQAAAVNQTYIQPGMKSLADGELAAQARRQAAMLGSTVQQGTKGLGEQFNRFVDPDAGSSQGGSRGTGPAKADFWDSFGQEPAGPPKEKKDFWDDFAAAGESVAAQKQQKSSASIGTSAMRNTGGGGGKKSEEDDAWGKW
jgi:ADP-ribosylation factor GTPase-activating protein 1